MRENHHSTILSYLLLLWMEQVNAVKPITIYYLSNESEIQCKSSPRELIKYNGPQVAVLAGRQLPP